jgi:hypothetical protein
MHLSLLSVFNLKKNIKLFFFNIFYGFNLLILKVKKI